MKNPKLQKERPGPTDQPNFSGAGDNVPRSFEIIFPVLIILLTLIPYGQTASFGFVNYDDPGYVYDNDLLEDGLTYRRMQEAIFGFHKANWHPLVWLSYMAEIELVGMKPGVMHITNVVLHIANSLLVYVWLRRSTRDAVRSLLAGLIFALHPMHVESVAWVTERKDVLSTLMMLATLIAYTEYIRRRSRGWYVAALVFFAVGLTAKGMLVTVPVVLLLVDIWPLRRFQPFSEGCPDRAVIRSIVCDKIPFLILSIAVSVITVLAQKSGGAVSDLTVLPITARVANAVVGCSRYCLKTVWPFQLSVFYPMPTDGWQIGIILASLLFLTTVSIAAFYYRRQHPALIFGWFWFLITLLPVIGLIQVGIQSIADRYTYVPMTGLSIALIWSLPDRILILERSRVLLLAVPMLILIPVTYFQVGVWRNSISLFEHSLEVEPVNNTVALHRLTLGYIEAGQYEKVITLLEPAVRIHKKDAVLWVHLGNALRELEQIDPAIQCFRNAVDINPDLSEALNNLGMLICRTDSARGKPYLIRAIVADRSNAQAHNSLGNALVREGNLQAAEQSYLEAIKLENLPGAKQNLTYVR